MEHAGLELGIVPFFSNPHIAQKSHLLMVLLYLPTLSCFLHKTHSADLMKVR